MISVLLNFRDVSSISGDYVDDARVQIDRRPSDSDAAFHRMLTASAFERCPRGYTVDEVGDYNEETRTATVYIYEG